MPADRTVLDHLLEGRDALLREIERLTTAKEELDAVIGRLDTDAALTGALPDGAARPVTSAPAAADGSTTTATPATTRKRARGAAKKGVRRSASRSGGEGAKSIRVHVLEMLAAENREFGLAEIIDRIHGAGIRAHDDAVRSITIKLMKDGTVERVGRGQYRLARPDSASLEQNPPADNQAAVTPAAQSSAAEPTGPRATSAPSLNLAQPWTGPSA